jgi:hypothetical protein
VGGVNYDGNDDGTIFTSFKPRIGRFADGLYRRARFGPYGGGIFRARD